MRLVKTLSAVLPLLLLASCATPTPHGKQPIKYRYENTLGLGSKNGLTRVVVTGFDDANIGEATRLEVAAGGSVLMLRNTVDVNGAMYCPAVEAAKNGRLIVRWDVIDECAERVELALDEAGRLKVIRREKKQR